MKIIRKDIDKLNSVLTIDIVKKDYETNVDKVLIDYKKRANIPGFRKGHTPIGLIRKQYGLSVKVDEVNKLMQKTLNDFLTKENLAILGNPIPKDSKGLDWNSDDMSFEFELGLSPDFEVSFNNKKAIDLYEIEADKKMIDSQITNIQSQYGKLASKLNVEDGFELNGMFKNSELEVENSSTFQLKNIKGKLNIDSIKKMKIGESIVLKTKGLFNEESDLTFHLKLNENNKNQISDVEFTLNEINERIPAYLDQDLFDKLFGKGKIKSVTELRRKLKEDAEKNFVNQTDQKLLNGSDFPHFSIKITIIKQ